MSAVGGLQSCHISRALLLDSHQIYAKNGASGSNLNVSHGEATLRPQTFRLRSQWRHSLQDTSEPDCCSSCDSFTRRRLRQRICCSHSSESNHKASTATTPYQSIARTALLAATTAAFAALQSAPAFAEVAEQITCREELGGADPNLVFVIACIAEFIALTGAAVGGIVARQRKQELEMINSQLRQINMSLRRQARVESYAPTLSYAPVGSPLGNRQPLTGGTTSSSSPGGSTQVVEAPAKVDTVKEEIVRKLKAGKRCLREQNPAAAVREFEVALRLALDAGDGVEQKKAARGLGASFQRQKKYRDAIKYHGMVLDVSDKSGENSGDTEAYGAIADCYTELGDLECAAKYYDKYIARLERGEELDSQE